MAEEKVRIKLHKELLASERQELKDKRRKRFLIGLLCFLFLIAGVIGGFVISGLLKGTSVAAFKQNKYEKLVAYFDAIWLYKDEYPDLQQTMEEKGFYGMTDFEEDPYTTYMSKEEIDEFTSSINMNFVGIGAQYAHGGGIDIITHVFEDSPAEKGGLQAGDILFAVDDQSIAGLTSDEIKGLITGQEGTNVKLSVKREGHQVDLIITRAPITYTAFAKAIDDVVILNIMSFGDSTCLECIKSLNEFKDYSKLIIDLRDNSGGYQEAVQEVAGLFLGYDEVVLNETDNSGVTKSYKTVCKHYFDNFKEIVIVTNKNTASAAEVLTIALKEKHKNAIQIGETTYGKGVVQSSFYLEDGSAVKITSSYWTSPNGVSINGIGVVPDEEVKLADVLYQSTYSFKENDEFKIDSVSTYVLIAQESLAYLDYDVNRQDGYFDASLKKAIEAYQSNHNLTVTSTLNQETYDALISSVILTYNTVIEKDAQLSRALEMLAE